MMIKWNNKCDVSDTKSLQWSVMIIDFIIMLDSVYRTTVLPYPRIFKILCIFISLLRDRLLKFSFYKCNKHKVTCAV